MSDTPPAITLGQSLAVVARLPITQPPASAAPRGSHAVFAEPVEDSAPVPMPVPIPETAMSEPTPAIDDPSDILAGFDPSRYLAGGGGMGGAHIARAPEPQYVEEDETDDSAVPMPVPMPQSGADPTAVPSDLPQPITGPRAQPDVMAMFRELAALRDH